MNEEFLVDISYSFPVKLLGLILLKVGVSFIVNLEDEYIEFYPHARGSIGFSAGPSLSFGALENYENPGDYRKWFDYGEAGYYIGVGHCFDPYTDYDEAIKAYYIEISSPNISVGRDYYYWNEALVFSWGGLNMIFDYGDYFAKLFIMPLFIIGFAVYVIMASIFMFSIHYKDTKKKKKIYSRYHCMYCWLHCIDSWNQWIYT